MDCFVSHKAPEKLYLKVIQGDDQGNLNTFKFQHSMIIYTTVTSFIDFETSSVMLLKDKVSKNAPKDLIDLESF